MNKFFKETLSSHISSNRVFYIIAVSSVLIGILLGIFPGIKASRESGAEYIEGFLSQYSTEGANPLSIFTRSLAISLRTVLIIWVSSWFIWLIPISFVELGAKGYGFGYSFSYLVFGCGIKGLAISLSGLLIQNILLIPTLIIYTVLQVKFSGDFDKIRKTPSLYKERKTLLVKNLLTLLFILAPILFCGLIDAYITPFFINFLI